MLLLWVHTGGGLPALEFALLIIGCGGGLITASIVGAAMGAVPPRYAGTASGLNNTARQTGTALGVAVFGAVAGSAGHATRFVDGLHVLAVVAVIAWAAAMVIAAVTLHARPGQWPIRHCRRAVTERR